MPPTVEIHEIYRSVQGESTHVGRPCTFVRLATCDIRCRWCDTEHAFSRGEPREIADVVARVRELGCPLVEVTGGEPLAQESAIPLLEALVEAGFEVLLETGGHRPIDAVPQGVARIIDVKCPGSRMEGRNHWPNLDMLRPGDEVKFVLADRADFDWAAAVVRERSLSGRTTVLFSPVWGELAAETLAGWILEEGLPVRLQIQLHKVLWGPDRKGV